MAVLDSNWVVLSQGPAPGSSVPTDTAITATIKKFTDKNSYARDAQAEIQSGPPDLALLAVTGGTGA